MLAKVLDRTLYRQFGNSAVCNKSFTVSFILPGTNNKVETENFSSAKEFKNAFPWGWRFVHPVTNFALTAQSLPNEVDPSIVYIAKHPFLAARLDEYSHKQITDKVFEDRACKALERHLKIGIAVSRRVPDNPTRRNGWRILAGEKDIAEWEGIWESRDGHYIFLEAKHLMDMNKVIKIRPKLLRSLEFLGIDPSKATVYIAGNHWSDEEAQIEALRTYKFGIMISNGVDFDVQEPNTT